MRDETEDAGTKGHSDAARITASRRVEIWRRMYLDDSPRLRVAPSPCHYLYPGSGINLGHHNASSDQEKNPTISNLVLTFFADSRS